MPSELELKYGCNPNQKPARIFMKDGGELPIKVLNGKPGLHQLPGRPQLLAAGEGAQGGHRPARRRLLQARLPRRRRRGPAAHRRRQADLLRRATRASSRPIACAYIRARGADRLCSYGDWAALSDVCDAATARYLKRGGLRRHHRPGLHRRGPGNSEQQEQGRLQRGRRSTPITSPRQVEHKDVFGVTFEQGRNNFKISRELLSNIVTKNKDLPAGREARHDRGAHHPQIHPVQLGLLRQGRPGHRRGRRPAEPHPLHPSGGQQGGQLVSAPAPQGARPASSWTASAARTGTTPSTSTSPTSTTDVLAEGEWQKCLHGEARSRSPAEEKRSLDRHSDRRDPAAATPSSPSATTSSGPTSRGVDYIAEPGGSIRDDNVIETADKYGMVMAFTGMRLFHH